MPASWEWRDLPQEVTVCDLELVHGLYAARDSAVDATSKPIPKAEQSKQLRVLDTEWSHDAAELTPKLFARERRRPRELRFRLEGHLRLRLSVARRVG